MWQQSNYSPRERSSGGYIDITLSVCPSVCADCVRRITFLWFDIGLPYLAHGCITMIRCVAYIHDPDMTLNFDLNVKFIGFLTCFRVRPITFLAHLSRRLKWAFLIKICPLSVVVIVNFSHFHLLLQNHWANFNQTWHKASLGEGDSSLFKWRTPPFSKER